mmetsp:Transcript_66701/g.191706  ORF Transcript_66701/g.191706 Transcript_66701/m.191706 type:complete len:201 (+) Transcript_66701:324-926(+)
MTTWRPSLCAPPRTPLTPPLRSRHHRPLRRAPACGRARWRSPSRSASAGRRRRRQRSRPAGRQACCAWRTLSWRWRPRRWPPPSGCRHRHRASPPAAQTSRRRGWRRCWRRWRRCLRRPRRASGPWGTARGSASPAPSSSRGVAAAAPRASFATCVGPRRRSAARRSARRQSLLFQRRASSRRPMTPGGALGSPSRREPR